MLLETKLKIFKALQDFIVDESDRLSAEVISDHDSAFYGNIIVRNINHSLAQNLTMYDNYISFGYFADNQWRIPYAHPDFVGEVVRLTEEWFSEARE